MYWSIHFPIGIIFKDPIAMMVDFISRKLAKYYRTKERKKCLGRFKFIVVARAEVSRNESIYLRVVGFRESMHDDYEPPSSNTKTHPSFSRWLVSSNDL